MFLQVHLVLVTLVVSAGCHTDGLVGFSLADRLALDRRDGVNGEQHGNNRAQSDDLGGHKARVGPEAVCHEEPGARAHHDEVGQADEGHGESVELLPVHGRVVALEAIGAEEVADENQRELEGYDVREGAGDECPALVICEQHFVGVESVGHHVARVEDRVDKVDADVHHGCQSG